MLPAVLRASRGRPPGEEPQEYRSPLSALTSTPTSRRIIRSCRRAPTTTCIGAPRGKHPGIHPTDPSQMSHRSCHDIPVDPGTRGDLPHRHRATLDRVQHLPQWATHAHNLPVWKTATANTHASASCKTNPKSVHLMPTSRRCAAKVATHGV